MALTTHQLGNWLRTRRLRRKRRCAFSSSSLTRTAVSTFRAIPHGIFSLLFPDECRICNRTLTQWTRVPVCHECLVAPAPLHCEYFCASCHTPFVNGFPLDKYGVCSACRSGLRALDRAASFGFYEGPLRSLIHLYKYSGMKPLARQLAAFLESAIPIDQSFDAVVPVPLHWRKQWQRGFNQAELLARRIAKHHGVPLLGALKRKHSTAVQATLAKAGRRRNVQGAFAIREKVAVAGRKILLIDDVMTTGATANACASVLKRAGAQSVSLVTLAMVDRRSSGPQ
jgi:ComF family protein